ncbi:MAG: MBL fold metallo-hydrolase [Bdellovibrionia bacterium]
MTFEIERILHAGYIFRTSKAQVLFDPIFEEPFSFNCYSFPKVEYKYEQIQKAKFDAIFISHIHDDHFSLESLNLLKRQTPIYIYCLEQKCVFLLQELGFENIKQVRIGESLHIEDITVTVLEALDRDVDSVFHISSQNINILHVVDSWLSQSTLDYAKKIKWDVILWPFQVMREIEALSPSIDKQQNTEYPIELLNMLLSLNFNTIVPSSCQFKFEPWSYLNQIYFPISYQEFKDLIRQYRKHTEIVRLDPGQSIFWQLDGLTKRSPSTLVYAVEKNVDYEFKPNVKVPELRHIVQNFESLSALKVEQLNYFLKNELLQQLQDLLNEGPIFKAPTIWQLDIVWNESNTETLFFEFLIDRVQQVNELRSPAAWHTEILALKMWNALYLGESLSSLYLRVNNDSKRQNDELDALQDPLLGVLFNSVTLSYQERQLQRLRDKKSPVRP